ncbi:MAG: LysM peptidoglycan-binding domain-containing protein [Opitutaceae bacterium]|nr:LysM peptidoglycan-binding domain-containing protein [Opitutaceae bacterium]
MKVLKIFGVVAGIHLFALLLIFANPGCSSTAKRPAVADTAPPSGPAPTINVPATPSSAYTSPVEPVSAAGPAPVIAFDPNTPAATGAATGAARTVPTRPDSAVASVLTSEPVPGVTPASTYVVKSGDNFTAIAKRHGITVAQLTAANSLSTSAILRPGQKLIIPGKAVAATPETASKSAPAAVRPAAEGARHIVKAGDTLGAIARSYGVSTGDIAVANNISDPAKIRPGMELVIPAAKGGAKSGKAAPKADASPAKAAFSPPTIAAPETAPAPAPAVPVIPIDEKPAPVAPKF